jgi:pyridoxine 4-dehydrogenase
MTGNGREPGRSFAPGPWHMRRARYGAMPLAGDGVFGPPRDRDEALRALRAAVAAGWTTSTPRSTTEPTP